MFNVSCSRNMRCSVANSRGRTGLVRRARRSKGVPEILALGTETALRLKSLERDEGVWGSASRTPDIGPRRRLRKQHHANPIYANACRAQCPELNTSECHPAPEARLSPLLMTICSVRDAASNSAGGTPPWHHHCDQNAAGTGSRAGYPGRHGRACKSACLRARR